MLSESLQRRLLVAVHSTTLRFFAKSGARPVRWFSPCGTYVDNHDAVFAHAHPGKELVMVLEITVCVLDNDVAWAIVSSGVNSCVPTHAKRDRDSRAEVAELCRMRSEPDTESPSRLSCELELFCRVLERILVIGMGSKREQLGRHCAKTSREPPPPPCL